MNNENDKELLELAAKSAGYELVWGGTYKVGDDVDDVVDCTDLPYTASNQPDVACAYWNPLEDDGDALRLAVKLRISVEPWIHGDSACARAAVEEVLVDEPHYGDDPERATRRAIVRAAAEWGKLAQAVLR